MVDSVCGCAPMESGASRSNTICGMC